MEITNNQYYTFQINPDFQMEYNPTFKLNDNVLRNNHATDSFAVDGFATCYEFFSSDNVAIGNTATGCTTEFAGSLPPAARFIDNIEW